MNKQRASKYSKIVKVLLYAGLFIYACLLFYLYYNQTLYTEGGLFESDLVAHIRLGAKEHYFYSLTSVLWALLSVFKYSNIYIALVLTAITICAIPATGLLVKKALSFADIEVNDITLMASAVLLNLHCAFYVKAVNAQHYIGYQCANLWHNSTYNAMRLATVLTLIVFLDCLKKYREGISFGQWLLLSVTLAIGTFVKPNFFLVFAPCFAIYLLVNWIKKTKFINIFKFGSTVFLSIAVLLIQNMVLFSGEENGYMIKPFYVFAQRGDHPKISLILSVLFPLVVFLFHIKDFYKDKLYFWSLVLYGIGFAEAFLFAETGARSKDANFLWGYMISIFVLFVSSFVRFIKDLFGIAARKMKIVDIVYVVGAYLIFVWHVLSGIWYFVILLTGATYFA